MKAVPYIKTLGTKIFKNFLNTPFHFGMLDNENGMFEIENGFDIKIHENYYEMKGNKIPLPKTINDFLYDMYRYDVSIKWKSKILNDFEPKDFLSEDAIENYYRDLLNKMEKDGELF